MSNSRKRKVKKYKPGALHVIVTILALALAAALLLAAVVLIAPLTERVDAVPAPGAEDWMARLDDAAPLNELILPGTGNSAARYTPRAFFTKRQALGIGEQLRAGYRFFDLRLGLTENGDAFLLLCERGVCEKTQSGSVLTLDDLLAECRAFLSEHPTEALLLSCRLADESASVRQTQLLLDAYVRENPEFWLLTDKLPTLGEARGKLVLLRSWEDQIGLREAAGIPFYWDNQSDDADAEQGAASTERGGYLLQVQDRGQLDADEKWDAFLSGFHSTSDGAVSLNVLGTRGEGRYGHPYEYAKDLNARLAELEDSRLSGWVLVDFGSARLAERIYRLNG